MKKEVVVLWITQSNNRKKSLDKHKNELYLFYKMKEEILILSKVAGGAIP